MLTRSTDKLLRSLNAIPWGELTHAHGSAENIPGLILQALSHDDDEVYEAISQVHHSVFHQDVLETITPSVVPILLQLLYIDEAREKTTILGLLASLAAEYSHAVGCPGWTFRRTPEYLASGIEPEILSLARETWAAVREGLPLFAYFLAQPQASIRSQAGRLIALVADDTSDAYIAQLIQAAEQESDPVVRASHVVALGVAKHHTADASLLALCHRVLQAEDPVQQSAAAIACAYLGNSEDDESVWEALRRAGQQSRLDHVLFPWADGGVPILAAEGLIQFAKHSRQRVIDALLESLRFQVLHGGDRNLDVPYEWSLSIGISEYLVRLVFPFQHTDDELLLREQLTQEQVGVLRELGSLGCHPMALSKAGIRHIGPSLRRFLGDEPPGPQDASVQLKFGGQIARRPIWYWRYLEYQGRVTRDELISALVEQLSPSEVLGLCQDIATGVYSPTALAPDRPVPLAMALLERIRHRVPEEIERFATQVMQDGERSVATVALAVVPLLQRWREEGRGMDEVYRPLIATACRTSPFLRKSVLELLPPHEQERLRDPS